MISQNRSVFVRLFCIFLVLLFLFMTLAVPVLAAEILYEILGVAARDLIASLIRACGVYAVDSTSDALNGFESLVDDVLDYVWSNLPDELKLVSVTGEFFLKMIFQNGLYYAPRTLVQLVCSALQENVYEDPAAYEIVSELGFIPRDEHIYSFSEVLNMVVSWDGYDILHSAAPNGSWCGDQRQLSAANGTLN